MKECPFCKEDNMSKSVYCCMCGKEFPAENVNESIPQEEPTKPNRRFVAFSDTQEPEPQPSKPAGRFKPM